MAAVLAIILALVNAEPAVYNMIAKWFGPSFPTQTELKAGSALIDMLVASEMAKK